MMDQHDWPNEEIRASTVTVEVTVIVTSQTVCPTSNIQLNYAVTVIPEAD